MQMEQEELKSVNKKLEILTQMVSSLQESFEDSFLSGDEQIILEESRKELEEGKCVSLEDLKKDLDEN